jgi:hypothetical protein
MRMIPGVVVTNAIAMITKAIASMEGDLKKLKDSVPRKWSVRDMPDPIQMTEGHIAKLKRIRAEMVEEAGGSA